MEYFQQFKIRDETFIVANLASNETQIFPGLEEVCLSVECQQSTDTQWVKIEKNSYKFIDFFPENILLNTI